ncbi:MAG: DUF4388 domain-containing protein [Polyangiales bacterium]
MSERARSVLIVDDGRSRAALAGELRLAAQSLSGEPSLVMHCAGSVDEARSVIEREPVDLVLLELREPEYAGILLVDWVFSTGRSIAFVAMAQGLSAEARAMLRSRGVFTTLQEPVDAQEVARCVVTELSARRARLEGVPLVAFLQMVAMDRSTGVVTVRSRARHGWLAVDGGDLVGASFEGLDGERAAHALVGLADAKIEMVEREFFVDASCRAPLSGVILEALRLRDEGERAGRWRSSMPASRELGDDFEVEFDVLRTVPPPDAVEPARSPAYEDSAPTLLTRARRDEGSAGALTDVAAALRPSRVENIGALRVARDARVQHALDGLVVSRAHGLLSAEVWTAHDGTPVAWHGAAASSSAVFDRMLSALSETLDDSGFAAFGRYFVVDLEDDRVALGVNLGEFRAGFVFEKAQAQISSVLSLITVEFVRVFQDALVRQTA